MFALAIGFMGLLFPALQPHESKYPDYMVGLIMIGLSSLYRDGYRMERSGERRYRVLPPDWWRSIASFQVLFFSVFAYGSSLKLLPPLLGLNVELVNVDLSKVTMGQHCARACSSIWAFPSSRECSRDSRFGQGQRAKEWYEKKFIPKISPITLIALAVHDLGDVQLCKGDLIVRAASGRAAASRRTAS